MSTWIERLQDELNEVTERLVKLLTFIATPDFRRLRSEQCNLMVEQSQVMMAYADILGLRLDEAERNEESTKH